MTATATLPQFGGDRAVNPAKFFAQWNGETGRLYYTFKDSEGNWKDQSGNKNIHLLSEGFTFVYLAGLNTVKGFSEDDNNGFYSNEVRDVRYEPLVVKCGQRLAAKGLWSEIRDSLKVQGAKFCKSLYIGFKDEDGSIQIGNIQATGAFMAAWFEFTKRNAAASGAVRIVGTEDKTKGKVHYKVPVFQAVKVSDEVYAQAGEKLAELKAYLDQYFANGSSVFEDVEGDVQQNEFKKQDDPFGEMPTPEEDEEAKAIMEADDNIPW